MTDPAARRRSILWRTRFANLFGAVMAFVYFRFIDPVTSGPGVTWIEIVFSAAAVTALMIIGARFNARWAVPMLTQPGSAEARRRALLFPWAMAGSTLAAWVVAGVIFAEKVFPYGARLTRPLAVAFIALGIWIALAPGSVPGLKEG